jgi:hypothetical protein
MSEHDDDRGGVPSASSMERVAHCPSSFNFERMFPEERSDIAKEGEFMHNVVMGFADISEATPSQQEDIFRAWRQRLDVIEATIGKYDKDCDNSRKLEERLWMHKGIKPVFSARFDELLIAYPDSLDSPCLLIDYKFGYKDVPSAKGNLQLRAQACLVYSEYGYRDIYCAIISPRAGSPTVTNYEETELDVSKESIIDMCSTAIECNNINMLNAGRWCDYCKARHVCPQAWGIGGYE